MKSPKKGSKGLVLNKSLTISSGSSRLKVVFFKFIFYLLYLS